MTTTVTHGNLNFRRNNLEQFRTPHARYRLTMSKNILNITLRDFAGPFSQFITNLLGDDGETWWTAFKRFLRKENPWVTVRVVKNLLNKMIADGSYDQVHSEINEALFPVPENLILSGDTKTIHYDRLMSSKDVIAEIAEMGNGWHLATLYELLDYGAKNPEEQRKCPIVALGSVAYFSDYHYAAYLYGSDSWRVLDLHSFNGGWDRRCRFLLVRT